MADEYQHAPRTREPRLLRHELGAASSCWRCRRAILRHGAADRSPLEQLAEDAWATPWPGTAYATTVMRACRAAGFELRMRHRVTDRGTLLDLARAGLAVALGALVTALREQLSAA